VGQRNARAGRVPSSSCSHFDHLTTTRTAHHDAGRAARGLAAGVRQQAGPAQRHERCRDNRQAGLAQPARAELVSAPPRAPHATRMQHRMAAWHHPCMAAGGWLLQPERTVSGEQALMSQAPAPWPLRRVRAAGGLVGGWGRACVRPSWVQLQ